MHVETEHVFLVNFFAFSHFSTFQASDNLLREVSLEQEPSETTPQASGKLKYTPEAATNASQSSEGGNRASYSHSPGIRRSTICLIHDWLGTWGSRSSQTAKPMNGGMHIRVTFQTCASCGDLPARPGSYKLHVNGDAAAFPPTKGARVGSRWKPSN